MIRKQFRKQVDIKLSDLSRKVGEHYDWAKNWSNSLSTEGLTSVMLQKFMRILFAAFYTSTVQGRPSAIESLTVQDGYELLRNGSCLSSQFKTMETYGYQPILVDGLSKKLLSLYLKFVRPAIRVSCPIIHEPADALLWINIHGEPVKKIGNIVNQFFRSELNMQLPPTRIRSLVETEAHNLNVQGVISNDERRAIMNVNGHSSATVQNFYIQHDRQQDGLLSKVAFQHIVPSCPSAVNNNDSDCSISSDGASVELTPWGGEHPAIQSPNKRAPWTATEVTIVGEWCCDTIKANPASRKTIVKFLLEYLRGPGKEKFGQFFHPYHVVDSGRLRNGYRIAQHDKRFTHILKDD